MEVPRSEKQMRQMLRETFPDEAGDSEKLWKKISERHTYINDKNPSYVYYGEVHHTLYHVFIYREGHGQRDRFHMHTCPHNKPLETLYLQVIPHAEDEPLQQVMHFIGLMTQGIVDDAKRKK